MTNHKNRQRDPEHVRIAQDAQIDRNLAMIQDSRRNPADAAQASTDREVAAELAADLARLADPTDSDPDTVVVCGRIMVAMAAALMTLYAKMANDPLVKPYQLPRVMMNVVSLTGERMAHGVYPGGPGGTDD